MSMVNLVTCLFSLLWCDVVILYCLVSACTRYILPYFGKRKQVPNVYTFLVKEQNVSVISTDFSIMMSLIPNISLRRRCVYAYNLAWKKNTHTR